MIFDGREYANLILQNLKERVDKSNLSVRLVWMCVGEDEASVMYGKLKAKAANKIGIKFDEIYLGDGVNETELRSEIKNYCEDKSVHGVMVQLPARVNGNLYSVLGDIWSTKDVDCLNPYSMGMLWAGKGIYLPGTVAAVGQIVLYALKEIETPIYKLEELFKIGKILSGKRVVIAGGGWEVGKPLAGLVSNWGASVLWVRSNERKLSEIVKMGDIVISATGKKDLIEGNMIKNGAIVIDVGSPAGDVDFGSLSDVDFVTPVPGGVGPVTVACLMANVVSAAEDRL